MAVVWQHCRGLKRYEVRKAGGSLRLYTNGVFHSQFNPRRPLGGQLWDLLFLPARLHSKPAPTQRILLLGVGGGAVINSLRALHDRDCEIVGVDLDPVHLKVAREFFCLELEHTQLLCADAIEWIKDYRGPPFDIVIDDLFGDDGGNPQQPQRAVPATLEWVAALRRVLASGGVMAFNLEGATAADRLRRLLQSVGPKPFCRLLRFSLPKCENVVATLLTEPLSRSEVADRLMQHQALKEALKNPRFDLIYRFSRLD